MEIIFLLFGVVGTWQVLAIRQRRIDASRRANRLLDENRYKKQWQAAVRLLDGEGRLSEDQLASIKLSFTPESTGELPRGPGFSEDRRDVEIARAKAGLLPADSLAEMHSEDILLVKMARIKYGTTG